MDHLTAFCESDARSVLSKHQRKATSHRVDVLLFLMRHHKAFTLRQLSDQFHEAIDRATVYRSLMCFVEVGLSGKALNQEGNSCFFYKPHLEADGQGHSYLECVDCDRVFDLPEYSDRYLNVLSDHDTKPLSTLLKGHCKRVDCHGQA